MKLTTTTTPEGSPKLLDRLGHESSVLWATGALPTTNVLPPSCKSITYESHGVAPNGCGLLWSLSHAEYYSQHGFEVVSNDEFVKRVSERHPKGKLKEE